MTAPGDASDEDPDDDDQYDLILFVSGASEISARAIADARLLCELHLKGRYRLAVVDLHDDPAAVLSAHVFAAPTLVRNRPLPVRRAIGNLSNAGRVLAALDLPLAGGAPTAAE